MLMLAILCEGQMVPKCAVISSSVQSSGRRDTVTVNMDALTVQIKVRQGV
jgi:hypothetical protein